MSGLGGKRTLPIGEEWLVLRFVNAAAALSLFALLAGNADSPLAVNGSEIPEENYDLLTDTDDTCKPKIGVGIEPAHEAECKRMTEPRRYRGTWHVEFETSFFTPIGRQYCMETNPFGVCLELEGEALPWPPRWACPRNYEIELIGRRNLLPRFYGAAYRIAVDRVESIKRLPDPPHEPGECDPAAP
jgi:hypothetical protein